MRTYYYNNIFLYSSLQFTGNIEEYFSAHTRKLVAFVLMPRNSTTGNFIRVYKKGVLVTEENFHLPSNIVLYYAGWYIYQWYMMLRFFSRKEKIIMITFHPISFFGMTVQKLLRRIIYVYWVADFFPPVHISLILFEYLKRFYNKRVDFARYLSDAINMKMNAEIIQSAQKRTTMWGIRRSNQRKRIPPGAFTILFVGVVRPSQGLEFFFRFLRTHKQYKLLIVGVCEPALYKKYIATIKKYGIENQIRFPNRFLNEQELKRIAKSCHAGLALYDVDETSATFYTDPGKVKTYLQMGLPVIMSNVSAVAPYIKRFTAGVIVSGRHGDLAGAIVAMKKNYSLYVRGVRSMSTFFDVEQYYRDAFKPLETV